MDRRRIATGKTTTLPKREQAVIRIMLGQPENTLPSWSVQDVADLLRVHKSTARETLSLLAKLDIIRFAYRTANAGGIGTDQVGRDIVPGPRFTEAVAQLG